MSKENIDLLCRLHDKFIEAIKSRDEEGKCCLTIDESKILDEVEAHIKKVKGK